MATYATTTSLSLVMIGVDFSATNMSTLGSKALDQAEAEINKYLSKRYDLATAYFQTNTSVPPMVRMMAERLSEGYMWQWLSRAGSGKEAVKRAEDLIDKTIENLKGIAEYKMDLRDTAGSLLPEASTSPFRVQCTTTDYSDTFAEDSDTAQAVDDDKLDDISDTRD